jgi:hypothetical protein
VKNKSKNDLLLNVHLYHQNALIEQEAGKVASNHRGAERTRLRKSFELCFRHLHPALCRLVSNSGYAGCRKYRGSSILAACLTEGWAKILSNAHGGITDEVLGRSVSVLRPALQHIAPTIYIRLQGDTDPDWLQNLRYVYIRRDEDAKLRYRDAARIRNK